MDIIIENPIALLFLSFAIGAVLHGIFSKNKWYQQYFNINFISDATTKNIGVLWIEWLILNSPLRFFNQQLKIDGRPTKEQLLKLRGVMTGAELSHIMGFILLVPFNIYYILVDKSWTLILGMFFLNLFFNGYTALTQQYNKRRLDKVLMKYM